LTANLFHDYSRPVLSSLDLVDPVKIERLFTEMEEEGRETLESEGVIDSRHRFQRTLDMRYYGQGFELNIETETHFTKDSMNKAMRDFHFKHREIYGYAEEEELIELVNIKLRVIGLLDSPKLKTREAINEIESPEYRHVFFETINDWLDVKIYDRDSIGSKGDGPAVIEQYDSTTVVYPNWSFIPDTFGNLILRRNAL
jgi:N-methylhydantoinase A